MKEIRAVVQQLMANKVIENLRDLPHLPGFTVSFVSGFSRSDPGTEPSQRIGEAPMTKIELVVPDALAEKVVETIAHAARTGRSGDGKIFVYEVADVIKIRTGEHGEAAI